MNVCLLNDSFPPVIDGVANAVLNYARVLNNQSESACVATPRYPGSFGAYPFPVIRYPSVKTPKTGGYRVGFPYPAKTVKTLAKLAPDVIHCHCPFVSAMLAKTLKSATCAPVVFTYHTKFDIDIENAVGSEFFQNAAKKLVVSNIESCDEVWTVSRGAGENLKSLGYTGGYRVMENGVDFPKGCAPEESVAALRRELALTPCLPVFLFVGRMMWYKGIKIILEALARAKSLDARFKMIFVGGGADFCDITDYSENLGLCGDVIFTGPVHDRRLLRTYFSLADLFLFPSDFDTNGIVVREAAACGLASVLLRGSAAAETVTDGRNSILFSGDPAELAAIIVRTSKYPEFTIKIGEAAMRELYLSWDDAVLRARGRYEEILQGRKHYSGNSQNPLTG